VISDPPALHGPRDLGMPPLNARSAILSLLLGVHPPELNARVFVTAGDLLGISEQTVRVALTRMVAAGDLLRGDGAVYRLSERLLARQRRQDDAIQPATRLWRGGWDIAIVTATGRTAAQRTALRADLRDLRLAELREGVWTRPDNLRWDWPAALSGLTTRFSGRPAEDSAELTATLWDLGAWSATGTALLRRFETSVDDPAARFVTAAAIVRHLLTDPVLPPSLLPPDWPGDELRSVYVDYQSELSTIAQEIQSGTLSTPR
jgi:phenylacetic acid degradation operon negative regulatory protein